MSRSVLHSENVGDLFQFSKFVLHSKNVSSRDVFRFSKSVPHSENVRDLFQFSRSVLHTRRTSVAETCFNFSNLFFTRRTSLAQYCIPLSFSCFFFFFFFFSAVVCLVDIMYTVHKISSSISNPAGLFYTLSLVWASLAMMSSIVVFNLHSRGPRRGKVPDTIRLVRPKLITCNTRLRLFCICADGE